MISKNELSKLYLRCENSFKIIKDKMKEESVNLNEIKFKNLEKLSEINMTYLVFLSEIANDEKKRYIIDDEYIKIIENFCKSIESF